MNKRRKRLRKDLDYGASHFCFENLHAENYSGLSSNWSKGELREHAMGSNLIMSFTVIRLLNFYKEEILGTWVPMVTMVVLVVFKYCATSMMWQR
jgi:hypothetical protein